MKTLLMTLFVLTSFSTFAESNILDARCSFENLKINGIQRKVSVRINMNTLGPKSRYQLNIFSKSINSEDEIYFVAPVKIISEHNSEYKLITDNKTDGYNLTAKGELFPNSGGSTYFDLELESFGSPRIKIDGSFTCTSIYNW